MNKLLYYRAIAIDFDGTICYEDWPNIGPPIPVARESLIEIAGWGITLYLVTAREGPYLAEAMGRLAEMGLLDLFGNRANCNPANSIAQYGDCRKLVLPRIDDADPFTPLRPDGAVDWPRVMDILRPLADPTFTRI